jgi:hypothetical protein
MTARPFGAIADRFVANSRPGRRTEQPVRRNSYDIDDRRAQVFRPIGDGTKNGGMKWRDRYLRVAKEYDRQMKKPGARHPIGANAILVLEALLQFVDFKTGRLDPMIATIESSTGFARKTVIDAMRRLKDHGFLNWVRRTERTGAAKGEGPQVKQATNAYFFDIGRLHARARMRLRQLLGRPPAPDGLTADTAAPAAPLRLASPELEAVLARMGAAFEGGSASAENSQNPGERI